MCLIYVKEFCTTINKIPILHQNTSPQKKLENFSKYLQTRLKIEVPVEKLGTSKLIREDSIILKILKIITDSKNQTQEEECCTVGSALQNKKKTLNVNESTSKKPTQTKKSSKTLAQASTGNEEASKDLWTRSLKDVSKKLWSPTKTDCVVSDLNLSSKFVQKTKRTSWFSVKTMKSRKGKSSNKIFFLLSRFLQPDSTAKGATRKKKGRSKKPEPNNVKVIPIKYTKRQRMFYNQCLGIQRSVYNSCIAHAKKEKRIDLNELRRLFVHQGSGDNYELRDKGVLKFIDNHKSSFEGAKERLKKKQKRPLKKEEESKLFFECIHNLKFLSWRNEWHSQASIPIQPREWKTKRGFYTPLCYHGIENNTLLTPEIEYTCRIVRKSYNKFFIYLPTVEEREFPEFERSVVSIDPGLKTFMTCYSPEGEVIQVGENDMQVIARLLHYKNKLVSKVSKAKPKKGDSKRKKRKHKRLRKALTRSISRITNLVSDYHKKSAAFLVNTYNVVIVPKLNLFKTKKLDKKTKEKAIALAFSRHVEIIKSQAVKTGCKVIVPEEHYTSKTCSCCGYIDDTLGSKRTYSCKNCKRVLDRDINASKNILLKTYIESEATKNRR